VAAAVPAAFDAVCVFSASDFRRRAEIGDEVTEWVAMHPERELVEVVVKQSSDANHHCLTIVVFHRARR
jgi:hypothetical protein